MSTDPRKRLEEEIQTLEKELREELPRALKTAAALGDLSENADYSAARERQDFVRVRLSQLKQRAADLAMVTSEDADATKGLISTTSPIGRSLLNKKVGDTVEVKIPAGTREFEVLSFT